MRGRGSRGRGSWRANVQNNQDSAQVDAFPAPPVNSQVPTTMDYYQSNMAAPAMEMSQEVPVSDSDVSMQDSEQTGESRKRPWEKPGGIKVKRKKVPGAKNLKIRRYVQPKNAVMCLNELRPGVTYTTEQEGGVGQPFCISVEVPGVADGQKYRGFGSSKQLAKQAAAEAALISFVKPPVTTATENQEEDKTPWATLASFAIYKLFNDWREGRVGMCPPPAQPYGAALPPGGATLTDGPVVTGQLSHVAADWDKHFSWLRHSSGRGMVQAFLNQTMGGAQTPVKEEGAGSQASMFTDAICAHLGGRAPNTPTAEVKNGKLGAVAGLSAQEADILVKVPNPAKQVPENASTMHPVMVLHQMKPGLQYNISQTTKESKPFFTVSAEIDGKEFAGEGPNVKKAKFFLAKDAIMNLYAVQSNFETPA